MSNLHIKYSWEECISQWPWLETLFCFVPTIKNLVPMIAAGQEMFDRIATGQMQFEWKVSRFKSFFPDSPTPFRTDPVAIFITKFVHDFIWHPMSVIIPYGFCHQAFQLYRILEMLAFRPDAFVCLVKIVGIRNNPCDHKRREMSSPFPHSMPYLPSFQCGCAHRGVVAWIRYHPLPIPMPTLYWYWQPAS